MYINLTHDRKILGYSTLKDEACGQRLIALFNYDSIIKKSILIRPEFLKKSCKKFKNRVKRCYFARRAGFIIGTTTLPTLSVMVPIPQQTVSLETLINESESNSRCKDFLKIAPTFMYNSNKIVLTNEEIRTFDLLSQQIIDGSITVDEAILKLRGGEGFIDLAVIVLFYTFINWLDKTDAFVPPHMDPVGYINGRYNQPPPGKSPVRYPFEGVYMEGQRRTSARDESRYIDMNQRHLTPHEVDKTAFESDDKIRKAYEKLVGSNKNLQKKFDGLEKKLGQGHFNSGREKGFQQWSNNIYYVGSHGDGARIYDRFVPDKFKVEILAYSNKATQPFITVRMKNLYDKT